MTTEPTLEQVQAEYPRWHCWEGIAGLVYARKPLTSPPVVVRAETVSELRDKIKAYLGGHDAA